TIEVSTEATDKVQIQVLRKVTGGSQEKADELFREHEVIFDQTGNTVSVTQKQKKRNFSINMGKPYLEVRYQIVIPRKFDVELGTSGGSIRLGDLDGAAIARTSSGSINFAKVSGNVEAANSGGDIVLAEVGGELSAHTSSGAIKVQKVGKKADLRDS